jgi:uncharacterized membrane protein
VLSNDKIRVLNGAPLALKTDGTSGGLPSWVAKKRRSLRFGFSMAVVVTVALLAAIVIMNPFRDIDGEIKFTLKGGLILLLALPLISNGYRMKKFYDQFNSITAEDIRQFVEMKKAGEA